MSKESKETFKEVRQPLNKYPLLPLYFWEQLSKCPPLPPQAYNQLLQPAQNVNAGLVLGSSRIGFLLSFICSLQKSNVGWPTSLADRTQHCYKCVIKLEKNPSSTDVKRATLTLSWGRVLSPVNETAFSFQPGFVHERNALFKVLRPVEWQTNCFNATFFMQKVALFINPPGVWGAHLRFKRNGVAFHKPTSTHFTLNSWGIWDNRSTLTGGGFCHELWDFLPALKKKIKNTTWNWKPD